LCLTITVVIVDRYSWPVHRSLLKVWTSISVKLGIQVRVETSLKDWVIREVDTANNVSRLELCNPLAQEKTSLLAPDLRLFALSRQSNSADSHSMSSSQVE
jgi:hypothetical protein